MEKEAPSEAPVEPSPLRRLLHFFGIGGPDTAEDLEQEIQELLEEGEEHGFISPSEGLMITGVLDLKDTEVREIMTPRTEMVCLPALADTAACIDVIRREGYTRIPVFDETPDHILGILHAKDLLLHLDDDPPPRARDLANPAFFVAENESVARLLRLFQQQRGHMAIVTDEFGITRGLVTLEDVLEEIVGEITDEHDDEKPNIRPLGEGRDTAIAAGRTRLEEVEEFFGVHLPEGPYESIGGLVTHQLGRVPPPGARVEVDGLVITVTLASKRRVIAVRIQRARPVPPA